MSAMDREEESVTGQINAVKHTLNEFHELFLDTLIVFYATVHYVNQRKYLEALTLSKHTLSQIENCLDFA